jgi:hypothetical protein
MSQRRAGPEDTPLPSKVHTDKLIFKTLASILYESSALERCGDAAIDIKDMPIHEARRVGG